MAEDKKKVSLHDLKSKVKSIHNNLIGDGDYYLRDKDEEAKKGYPNTFDMTPPKTQEQLDTEAEKVQKDIDSVAKANADAKILAEENAKRDLKAKSDAKDKVAKMNAAKQVNAKKE